MTDVYDLAVIGGGIHGAGVAQAAAAAGWSVVVLERTSLAAGTSSRSSKLIHGGLRYLENHQYALVKECLRERALLLRNAPDLVHLVPFYLPVYRSTRRRPAYLRLGLSLYALLGGLVPAARFRRLSRAQWAQLDGLETQNLDAVFEYHDAQTDDAALTRAVMHAACTLGAQLRMPAEFEQAQQGADRLWRIDYRTGISGAHVVARTLVNAAGPWIEEVQSRLHPRPAARAVDLVQGTHIVLSGTLERGIYYVESSRDGRAIFVMPWQQQTLIGTTETPYHGDPALVVPLAEEVDHLRATASQYFPHLRQAPLLQAYAGLRVLPRGPGAAFARSRDTLLDSDTPTRPTLIAIYGGKLTAYRATAERVIARLRPSLPTRVARADTRTMHLLPVPGTE